LWVSPKEAMKKLEILEMDRIAERSSLKHSGTGKWAKHIRKLAKKDPQLRETLQTQLRLGKELSEKVFAKEVADTIEENQESDDENAETQGPKSTTRIDLTPKLAQLNAEDVDENDDQNAMITEAFEDDDVMEEELNQELKDPDDDASKYELNQDGEMPGWNNWAGPGLMEKRRNNLKKRLAKEETTQLSKNVKKRRNCVIMINKELANQTVKKYQVKQTPFPYTQADLFEENMAQPVGKEWNTQTSYKMLIDPSVKVRKGHVIDPISTDNVYVVKEDIKPTLEGEKKRRKKKTMHVDGEEIIKL